MAMNKSWPLLSGVLQPARCLSFVGESIALWMLTHPLCGYLARPHVTACQRDKMWLWVHVECVSVARYLRMATLCHLWRPKAPIRRPTAPEKKEKLRKCFGEGEVWYGVLFLGQQFNLKTPNHFTSPPPPLSMCLGHTHPWYVSTFSFRSMPHEACRWSPLSGGSFHRNGSSELTNGCWVSIPTQSYVLMLRLKSRH